VWWFRFLVFRESLVLRWHSSPEGRIDLRVLSESAVRNEVARVESKNFKEELTCLF
jgi:hypothetical protein